MREAWIVVDLGFGDAGKGATVDFLVRDRGADLVVRFNGGAQAGHTVVLADGRHHTFAQFGAGTFVPGVRSHLGPEFVLHPGGLLVEADRLAAVRVSDALARLTVDARATVISPFQQAAGRLRELLRGDAAHGTCGVGVGEAVGDRLAGHDDVLVAADLRGGGDVLLQRLARQQRRKRAELRLFAAGPGGVVTGAPDAGDRRLYALRQDARAALEWGLLSDPDAPARVVEAWAPFGDAVRVARPADAEALLRQAGAVVFEGAQGVLLDQVHGFHPHTTWSDCTPARAEALIEAAGGAEVVRRLGVLRTCTTRHGAGPLPTHDPALDAAWPEPHNAGDGWQGAFRRGALDLVLARYARDAVGGVDGVALTHLDQVSETAPVCRVYRGGEPASPLRPPAREDLACQERLGRWLAAVEPQLERLQRGELIAAVEAELGAPVALEADGPTAGDRRWRRTLS